MRDEITIRFSGEQGSGVQYIGQLAANYLSTLGYYVFVVSDFESRIRGGYSFTQLWISRVHINSVKKSPDILIPFSKTVINRDVETILDDTLIIVTKDSINDSVKSYNRIFIDSNDILRKDQLKFINTFLLSILAGVFGTDLGVLKEILKMSLTRKGDEVVASNIVVSEIGYKYGKELRLENFRLIPSEIGKDDKRALSGSLSLANGIAEAGCKFYCAYPMSPSTSAMEHIAEISNKFGIIVEQAEDEISALNMALGAAYTGVRSMTGTSGGGLALMGETVSLAAIAEIPIVILNAQRPGPATGLPTRTEQGDLFFTLFMGHGEFTKIVLAPGSQEKTFELAQKAFYLADKYQVSVFILTDQYLMDSIKTCEKMVPISEYKERFILFEDEKDIPYLRYKITDNGISERKIPGFTNSCVVADSHIHDEAGLITEDGYRKNGLTEKFLKKKEIILDDISKPYIHENNSNENLVIGWGSTFGVISDAVKLLNKKKIMISHMHFHEIYPLHVDYIKQVCEKYKNVICVENNATGQFASLLKMEVSISVENKILKYNGRPFYLDELMCELERNLSYDNG